jgi:hypothetical protein
LIPQKEIQNWNFKLPLISWYFLLPLLSWGWNIRGGKDRQEPPEIAVNVNVNVVQGQFKKIILYIDHFKDGMDRQRLPEN